MEANSGHKAATGAIRKTAFITGASLVALAVSGGLSPAAAQTWNGNTSDDWTVGSNWSTGTPPTTGTVTINTEAPNPTVIGVSGAATATSGLLTMGTTAGTSTLTVQNGSTLTSAATGSNQIGQGNGANATVTVTGAGSTWAIAGAVILGSGAGTTGTLNVANGASASMANSLNLGANGVVSSAILNVTGGGTLTTGNSFIYRTGSSVATISGAGSQWSVGGSLAIGNGIAGATGSSTMNVDNGGAVAVTGAINIGGSSLSQRGVATITVTGAGSQLSSGGTLNIGQWGTGTLTVSSGATATADAVTLGVGAPGSGTLNLIGATLASRALTGGIGLMRQVNFDGSLLRATASNTAFVSGFSGTELNIAAGGLTLDSAGFDVTAVSPFTGTGALIKIGLGTAALTGDSSYTGGTTISAGTLQLGNGGTNGSITGDVANNAVLAFNRSDTVTFGGLISGTGALTQAGSGTTILTAANTYTGGTTISAGALLVNGDQSAATGTTNVASGAALGGSGIIGGDVIVADGGILSPGNSPGTLTINGDLSLSSGSVLNYEFGQANAAGGALNDLVTVGGDLTLDGTINVTQSVGGSFGPGVYRIINYAGALTDNGLTVGTLPGGSTAFVQTAIANQVNLVNTAGLTLNFWDGAVGPKNDGMIQGGSGTWRVGGGQNNWTEVNGLVNADYAQDSFAIFQGTGGTVTVDNGGGNVSAAGMQFTADGYTIAGGPLELTGTQASVRIGDGSAGDAAITATIDATLTGSAQLVKDMGGMLVLTGANSYTGGTAINGGTIRISQNLSLGDNGGVLSFNDGTLNTAADMAMIRNIDLVGTGTVDVDAGTLLTVNGTVSGGGAFVKNGAGLMILTADDSYTGGTTVNAGILQVGSGTAGSIVGDVVNNAQLAFARSDDIVFAGTISGGGSLSQLGAGVLTLTTDNSYTGTTSISNVNAGTLQLGNGGTTGSVTSNIVNGGTLIFNRSNQYSFAGTISGIGQVHQAGSGTTILTGANSYTSATSVSGGTLLINGDQSLATGSTSVVGGATLGGMGTIGGDVFVGGGAVLAPGSAGVGTLTINGDLGFSPNATLAFEFGQANVPGGALNDLVDVGGDLTLDGTIDVTQSAGGSFGPGVYRIINYAGTLTDNGLTVGTMPGGSQAFVQTVVAGQVNLVNTAGLTLGFWDGAAGPKNDGMIQGGNGSWRVGGGPNNWTEVFGAVNADYAQDSFAIFSGTGGTVTVDNGGGDVRAAGMQFAVNGYTLAGAPLTLTGTQAFVRVGDGSAGEAGITGTISAALTGSAQLVKDMGGTLVLTGANSYTGGTAINGGTLSVSSDANLGAAAGGLSFNGGMLRNTATFISNRAVNLAGTGTFFTDVAGLVLRGAVTGPGALIKDGTAILVLAADSSYAGGTTINAGMLQLGEGGTTGSILGNIVNNARFAINRSDTLTLAGIISGNGEMLQAGTGTTILTAANSYMGATRVAAGTLLINGNQSAATGLTAVAANATLGGTGTIGGNLLLGDGTLAPGAGGAGTLTINGNLAIAQTATLAYEFGQANVAGGALNDLVNVGGNLTLDGTINVSVAAGGAFDAGIYRVFNYGGTLTNNGLTLGAMPAGSNVTVQTSIAGQVNLVNSAGLSLAFWDGAAGPKNNGAVNGGTGIWQSGTGNDNWADATGAVNAPYSDGAFSVFGGTGGMVTVDNGPGQVTAGGMQFAANGYTVTGGAIALTGTSSAIRVGDGSTAGAEFTATINSVLSGNTQLVKTDAGTLVLGGANSYTGGTAINGGTVQVSSDANLGDASGGVTLDGGTLATSTTFTSARDFAFAGAGTISTANGTTFTLGGRLTGTGAFTKAGGGTLVLTGDSSGYAGSTQVQGTLAVNGSLCGDVNVLAGARLQGIGTVCTTHNAGTIAPGNSIGTLTVAGDYSSTGGRLEIEAELGGDASPADRLVVTSSTSGTTQIEVINVGGTGAQTVEGIKIVDVGGASSGVFTLRGDYVFEGDPAIIAGAYGYRLYKNGVSTPTDGDWYLRSSLLEAPTPNTPNVPLYQPGVPVYEAYGQTLLTLTDIGTLQQRIGNRQWAATESGQASGIWGRMQSSRTRPNAVASTSLSDVNVDSWKLELGADHVLSERSDGATLVLGVIGGYGEAQASIGSIYGNGGIKAKGYSAGATLTWFGPQGFYVDGRAQVTWFDSKLTSSILGALVDGNDGTGQAYSVEVGKRSAIGGSLSVTPQIQMVYSTIGFDRFTDPNEAEISSRRGDSLKTRWGISLDRQDARSRLYGVANLSYEWLDGTLTDVSGTPIARENHRLWGELGIGGSVLLGDRLTLYTEASANSAINDFGKSYSLKGVAGLRLAF